ncbi:hypothetical protein DFP72DRAFT_905266 [Ephemerocybe angulata]|uniref:Uncharacterized protein n=1 Tax=Ephemerocybe angulata TaxID=980116 RepID=A0A8H6M1P2_9AGAR|nr:hypothetical protein DFP72DRAFT_905266 [Tulosesus angulatus]
MTTAEKFMNICALEAFKNKSFEEVRVDDYLKAYTTTGKPPPPVPQTPVGDLERAALGLPPIFQPIPASAVAGPSSSSTSSALLVLTGASGAKPAITNPAELPVGQELNPIKVDGETYQSISCMPQYAFFSFEELRYYAYRSGHKAPPPGVRLDPFMKSVVTPSTTSNATPSALDPPENLQNTASQPAFADHNFEELRVYYLLAGREVNSAEIRQYLGQPAVAPPTLPGSVSPLPTIGVTAPTPPAAPSLFGGLGTPSLATPIQPKSTPSFSFKF